MWLQENLNFSKGMRNGAHKLILILKVKDYTLLIQKVLIIYYLGFVRIWDTEKKGDEALIKTYKAHTGRINALLIVQDRYIVTGGDDKIITVADEDDECETFQFEGHEKEITAL